MRDDPVTDPIAWRAARPPSLADMEVLARETFAALPEKFQSLCEGLIIRIDDFAPDDVLDDLEVESEYDLLGLFQGVGLPFSDATAQLPNMIWLYRCPILEYWAEHDDSLGAVVAHVLVHEIGHHFGLSDDDMEAIERAAVEAEAAGGNAGQQEIEDAIDETMDKRA